MSAPGRSRSCVELAVSLAGTPSLARSFRQAPVPADVDLLLRVLARAPDAEAHAVDVTGKPLEHVRSAAEFYVTQILLAPDADPWRMLGARCGASRETLRTNLGHLMRWAHPDFAGTVDRRDHFQRILKAWEAIQATPAPPTPPSLGAVAVPSPRWRLRRPRPDRAARARLASGSPRSKYPGPLVAALLGIFLIVIAIALAGTEWTLSAPGGGNF